MRYARCFPLQNEILVALSDAELRFLLPHLQWVKPRQSQVLHEAGELPHPIYFLTRGVVAVSISTHEGKSLELSLIGRESIVGERAVFEGGMPMVRCEMLTDGAAYQMTAEFFNEEFQGGGKLHDLTMRILEVRFLEASQTALCAQMHSLEQRLCRWILTFCDRFESDCVPLTHQTMARMLGVRRAGISTAIGALFRSRTDRARTRPDLQTEPPTARKAKLRVLSSHPSRRPARLSPDARHGAIEKRLKRGARPNKRCLKLVFSYFELPDAFVRPLKAPTPALARCARPARSFCL